MPWIGASILGATLAGNIPEPARFGLDVIFPAAMAGLAVGLITGRRELAAAVTGAVVGVVTGLAWDPAAGIVVGGRAPCRIALVRPGRTRDRGRGRLSTNLVWLALLMAAVTYPARAIPLLVPGMRRLPSALLTYLQLVGPAVLASLAAVSLCPCGRIGSSRAVRWA